MSSPTWRKNWVTVKCDVARRLSDGEAGGSYAEAAILVCTTLSALSAELWEGRGIDRVRFIEALAQLGPNASECRVISVPLLTQHLDNSQRGAEAILLRRAFSLPTSARVVTGPDVDQTEDSVLLICPELEVAELRRFSYASILYGEVRSSYAHTYKPGEMADSWPMTMLANQHVSYINRLNDGLEMQRLAHFHFDWLAGLAIELASVVDGLPDVLPRAQPQVWWVQGGPSNSL